jgi:hypothetical protein
MILMNGQVFVCPLGALGLAEDAVAYAGRRITFVLTGVRE